MLRFSQLTKYATLAITIAAIGTSSAQARPAQDPPQPASLAHSATTSWTPPRVESTGVRPVIRASSPAQPIPLAQPATQSGLDWLSATVGASALLALILLLAVVRSTLPRRHRIAPPSA